MPSNIIKCLLALALIDFLSTSNAQAWWNGDWTQRKKITLDASSTGVQIPGEIGTTTVLLRLHDGDFQFSAAKDDGSDLRFLAEDDKTPLSYHIEKYDSLLGEALVWVKIPDIKGEAVTTFWLYYGNNHESAATGGADPKASYDSEVSLVYHFAENGQPAMDSTANGNNAQNAGVSVRSSFIGAGLKFDGTTTITIPVSPSLALTAAAPLTVDAWIKLGSPQPNAVILSRRDGAGDFLLGINNDVPFIEVSQVKSQGGSPLPAGSWHHLAAVADGTKTTLFVDGISIGSVASALPAMNTPWILGGDTGGTGFNGELDNLEIIKAARPPGYIKFASVEEGADSSKLLNIAQDEQPSNLLSAFKLGYFGVILGSVTVDGWAIILVLLVMAIISWRVALDKYQYLNVIQKGNELFIKNWREVGSDLTVLEDDRGANSIGVRMLGNEKEILNKSSLFHIYHIGAQEIRHRLDLMGSTRALPSESITAIKASLDGGVVRENEALNRNLVFLTIAIAGGPFIGLLGTVVGVMITFAAVAAAGEVNVNAIAPGISAALVATAAGLLVAIPALFAYNYIVSRIETIENTTQIFVDEFITKVAEFYRPRLKEETVDFDAFVERLSKKLTAKA